MTAPLPDLLVLAAVAVTALADTDARPYVLEVLGLGVVIFGVSLWLWALTRPTPLDTTQAVRYSTSRWTKKAPQSCKDHGAQ
jgi:hypothetical protein